MRDAVKMARSKQYSVCISNKYEVESGKVHIRPRRWFSIIKLAILLIEYSRLFKQPYFAVAKAK